MAETVHEGHCLCGAVKYAAKSDPLWVAHCHCGSCRRHTGGAVASFVGFTAADFEVTEGTLGEYASSSHATRSFCARCGTPMAYRTNKLPEEIHLYLGTLRHPERYTPQVHVHCAERLPWLHIEDEAERYDRLP